jgi:hypothetical protein
MIETIANSSLSLRRGEREKLGWKLNLSFYLKKEREGPKLQQTQQLLFSLG